jgi:hypothetical protein
VSTSASVIETEPTPEHVQSLEDRLYEFNASAAALTDGQVPAIRLRGERDRTVAGIGGHTWGGCSETRQYWVASYVMAAQVFPVRRYTA